MADAYIYDAVRTPRGKGRPAKEGRPGGALSGFGPHELVNQLIEAIGERQGGRALSGVVRMILGCVGQIGDQGGHIALVSRLASRLDDDVAVKSINNYCVSGLTAINEGALWARAGEVGLTLAGGVEMLSRVPFLADGAAFYNDPRLMRRLDYLSPIMGAELIATLDGFEKQDLDAMTYRSHQRAHAAWEEGRYDASVIEVKDPDGHVALARDEWITPGLTMEKLGKIKPAFADLGADGQDTLMLKSFPELEAINHVHSVANTPGISDGAALALIGSLEDGKRADLRPKARIRAIAEVTGDPILQFGAGFAAMEKALAQAGLSLHELDLIEFMEAFAAPPLRFERQYEPDPERVNVNGGHLAMGHPMGATGAILTATLLHELERRGEGLGIAVALGANGIGSAMVLERV